MGIKVANNAFATLAAGISNSETSITVSTGQGARFPALSAGDYFYATLINTSNQLEIVECTARSGDVLTVVRAQEATAARAYDVGDRIEIRITAATFEDATAIYDVETTSTGFFAMPSGTTAQRPASPVNGMLRYNTTLNRVEAYESGAWRQFDSTYEVEYLVVAGGGGGGSGDGGGGMGGGGAGGLLTNVNSAAVTVIPGTGFTITVGAGGAGGIFSSGLSNGAQGSSSSFGTLVSTVGGGFGNGSLGSGTLPGGSGGSGGGGSGNATTPGGVGGSGTSGQGFAGGTGGNAANATLYYGGAGGGASAVGQGASDRASSTTGCTGGAGAASTITGSSVTYAGGGGGGVIASGFSPPMFGGAGGAGGGGKAGDATVSPLGTNGVSGTTNTGGGGGGAGYRATSGNGGSGIVIIRYVGPQRGTGGTVTSSGGYIVHTFTSSGTFTA